MRNPSLRWSSTIGWYIELPVAIHQRQLRAIALWAADKQKQRLNDLPHGDRKEHLRSIIPLLEQGKLTQRVVGADGSSNGLIDLFKADRLPAEHKAIFVDYGKR